MKFLKSKQDTLFIRNTPTIEYLLINSPFPAISIRQITHVFYYPISQFYYERDLGFATPPTLKQQMWFRDVCQSNEIIIITYHGKPHWGYVLFCCLSDLEQEAEEDPQRPLL